MNKWRLIQDHTKAQPGDLGFTSHIGVVDKVIRITTTSMISHVFVVENVEIKRNRTKDGKFLPVRRILHTIEAFPARVRRRKRSQENDFFLDKAIKKADHTVGIVSLFRPPIDKVNNILNIHRDAIGTRYDFVAVIRLGLMRIYRIKSLRFITVPLIKVLPNKDNPNNNMCSELAGRGIGLFIPYTLSPGDLREYLLTQL